MISILINSVLPVLILILMLYILFKQFQCLRSNKIILANLRRIDNEFTQIWKSHASIRTELAATGRLISDLRRSE